MFSTLPLTLRILKEFRFFWKELVLLLVCNLAAIPLALLLPIPLQFAVDHSLHGEAVPWLALPTSSYVAVACGLEFLVLLVNSLIAYAIWSYQLYVAEKINIASRHRLFQHVQRMAIEAVDRRGIGELVFHLQNDVRTMNALATDSLIPLATTLLTFLSMFAVAFGLDPWLALVALGALPFIWIIASYQTPRARQNWSKVRESEQAAWAVMQEALGALRVVRAFGREDQEAKRFLGKSEARLRLLVSTTRMETFFGLLSAATVAIASAAALYLGLSHVRSGALSLGQLLLIMGYIAQLLRPLDRLNKYTAGMQAGFVSAERLFALHAENPRMPEGNRTLTRARGEIVFAGVGFEYDRDQPVLSNVTFTAEPGSRIGVIGPTGGGKTTLVNLLLRFIDPSAGTISLDGTDFRDYKLADLRRQCALVLQDPVLFSGSIAENIAYGMPEASLEQVQAAAKAAHAHDFIQNLPQGYRTEVGERGMALSGGERQRVSIARAFLLDAPVLVLDEPTSSLDSRHELEIAAALDRFQRGRTTFIISHRSAILENCDVTLVVDGGTVNVRKK